MTFAAIDGAGEWVAEFADQAVVADTKVAEFEGEGYEVGYKVWCVHTAVDKYGALDVRVC